MGLAIKYADTLQRKHRLSGPGVHTVNMIERRPYVQGGESAVVPEPKTQQQYVEGGTDLGHVRW